jgi:DeoR/GlpR family transcriptional regulator of sugar metabolism
VSLIGEERKRKILELLNEKGKVKVRELAELFNVSTESVRRYLDELNSENKLKKVYGGAVKTNGAVEPPHLERININAEAKQKIGKLAADFVEDNDVIVIDEGSTPLTMIEYLWDKKNITIMTSSIPALTILIDYKKKQLFTGRVIFIGGEVNAEHLRVSGFIAEKIMEDFYVNKAFISVDGITIDHGITSFDPDKALLVRKFIQHAEQTIVLADHSKIGNRSYVKIGNLEDVDMVICDQQAPSEWEMGIRAKGIEWISSPNELY